MSGTMHPIAKDSIRHPVAIIGQSPLARFADTAIPIRLDLLRMASEMISGTPIAEAPVPQLTARMLEIATALEHYVAGSPARSSING